MTTVTKFRFISQSNKQAFRNPWVLSMIAAIVLVLGVNIAFISTAFVTSPGLVEENYYEHGRFNEKNYTQQREARNRLGWNLRFDTPEQSVVGQRAFYRFSATDKAGLPINDATVTVRAYRPSDASADFHFTMERIAPGIYESAPAFPLKGLWDLQAQVVRGEDSLTVSQRISVAAQ